MSRKRRDSVKASNNGSKNAGPALDMGLDMAMEMMMPDVEVTSQDHTEGTHPSNETALATDCIPLGRVGVNNAEHEYDLLRKLDETMQTLENLMMENEQISEQKDDLVAKLEGTMDAVDELVVENEQLEGQLLEAKTDIVSIKTRFNAAVAQLDFGSSRDRDKRGDHSRYQREICFPPSEAGEQEQFIVCTRDECQARTRTRCRIYSNRAAITN
jgi:hypothetical protein